jgi:hypothetical protein
MITRNPRIVTPGNQTPEDLLASAIQQYFLLLSGQATAEIETPQLGRVVFAKTTPADLQRLIGFLARQVDPCSPAGQMAASMARRPINIEAIP